MDKDEARIVGFRVDLRAIDTHEDVITFHEGSRGLLSIFFSRNRKENSLAIIFFNLFKVTSVT